MLDQYQLPNQENRSVFKNRAVIWILGKQLQQPNYRVSWEKMIQDALGITNYLSIVLDNQGKRNT